MGFKLWWRGDVLYSRKHNDTLDISSYVDGRKRPVVSICHPMSSGQPYAATEINTWSHLDEIFEALIEFERYGSTLLDDPRNYALSRGVKVSTFTNESFNK